jgi:hypothetical protein
MRRLVTRRVFVAVALRKPATPSRLRWLTGYEPVCQATFELGEPVQALGDGIRDSRLTDSANSAAS